MAYKGIPNPAPSVGLERVNKIISDIDSLTHSELHMLRYRLNNQFQSSFDVSDHPAAPETKNVNSLSRREIDVLTLVAAGYSRKEIGASLNITSNTAAKHVSSIYRKLNISSIAEATRIAMENGILSSRSANTF